MYYSCNCTYCGKLFYTYSASRERAASVLYYGIKQHLIDYGEDAKEFQFDEHPSIEVRQMYRWMSESNDRPRGGYEL